MGLSPHGGVLRKLLPPGKLFSDSPGSMLQALLDGLGIELDRSSELADDLPRQLDPAEGDESLSDWERVLGLPDGCGPAPVTVADRRRAVLGRLQSGDNLSRNFYVELARAQGYTARVEELESAPFRCGSSRAGDTLGTEAGVFAWTLVVRSSKRHPFRVGASRCGTPLGSLADQQLECVIERAAPAHTQLGFRYEYDGDTGSGGPVDECWWLIGNPTGPDLRMLTKDGEMVVYGEDGAPFDIGLRDGSVPVLDENGVEIEVPIQCEIEPQEGCVLKVGVGGAVELNLPVDEDALAVLDEAGAQIQLPVVDQALEVLDEDGEPISLPLSCGDVSELWWHVLDASGDPINVQTTDGALMATLEDGSQLAISEPEQPFTVLDEAGNTLTIALSAEPA
jgi:uncharacterized protein YmfQ (DUF2313 family)/uncharacterized lipoprotein NlpE involved in copper resistance